MKLSKAIVTVALFSVSVLAHAASVAYTDQTNFNAALSTAGLTGLTQDFTAAAAANGVSDTASYGVLDPAPITVGSTVFTGLYNGSSTGSAGFLTQNTYGITGAFYTHQLFSENGDNLVEITFAAPVMGFGFTNGVLNIGGDFIWPTSGNANLTLTTSSGDTFTFLSPFSDPQPGALTFSGVISDTAFTSVTLAATQAVGLQITDFTVAAVPEPGSYALMLAGLGMIGFMARRRV